MGKHNVGLLAEINQVFAMTYCINATHIFIQDDGCMVIVSFADDEFEPSKFVVLQKAHKHDDQDKQLSMDKIHIQVEDESRSKYGGIKAIYVNGGTIQISLEDKTKSALGIDGDIEINVSTDHPVFEKMQSQLKKISELDGITFSSRR